METNEYIKIQTISKETWISYFGHKQEEPAGRSTTTRDKAEQPDDDDHSNPTRTNKTMKRLKNRKASGPDEIHNELIKNI